MQVYQKRTKKMSEFTGNRTITAGLSDKQMDRFLLAFGHMNRAKFLRELIMNAVAEKELENSLQQKAK